MNKPLFELYRGDDHAMRLSFTSSTGEPFSIEGWAFVVTLKISPEIPDDQATVQVKIPAVFGSSAKAGVMYFTLPNEQTKNLLPAPHFFDIQKEQNGYTNTILSGKVKVLSDVTRETYHG